MNLLVMTNALFSSDEHPASENSNPFGASAPIVLARKWRPKQFAQVVGQDHVVKALSHALDAKRLHHAYLLTGTRGRLSLLRLPDDSKSM
jgi:replication-associated recombination protein RarA